MKKTLGRTWIIYIFVVAFIMGLLLLTFRTVTNAPQWVDKSYNGHIVRDRKNARSGKIYDRKGRVLIKTDDKERKYTKDKAVRKALLHVLGDDSRNISTAILSRYKADLIDYSLIWGLDMPKSFRKNADQGGDVVLSVDAKTCKVAYKALREFDSGACVIYNYKTGEIICDVSTKTYDPENPPKITKKNESKYDGVYLDNALSSSYTPGSIFKIVTLAAALENIDTIDGVPLEEYEWHCECTNYIGGTKITCVHEDGDNDDYNFDLKEAFKYSCNYVFADLAVRIGTEKMNETAEKMGINATFDINGIDTMAGQYDVTDADDSELAASGYGQHTTLVNPIQMMTLCGAIANGGTPVIPHLIERDDSTLLKDTGIDNNGSEGDRLLSDSTAEKLREYMEASSSHAEIYIDGLTLCAKTGTAEINEKDDDDLNNGWVVGFCKDEDCPLAFACVVHKTRNYGAGSASVVMQQALAQAKTLYK